MKAAVFLSPGVIEIRDIPKPLVSDSDVLVKVQAASVCGTDLRIMKHGHFKLTSGTPRVLGHEFSGEIVEVGSGVADFHLGDRVSVTPNVGCGSCKQCSRGLNQMCPNYEAFGITIDGGFQEYALIPGRAIARGNLHRIPKNVTYEFAALIEPLSCCHSGQNKVEVSPEDSVLIIGAGPIGCFHTMLAKQRGAKQVIVANTKQFRLDIAGQMGADHLINVSNSNLSEEVMRITNGEGVDVIITCVSKPEVIAEATSLLAIHGRVNVFSGLGMQALPQIDVNSLHYKAQTITGTTGSSVQDYIDVIEMMSNSDLDVSPIISERFPVERLLEAMEHSASGSGMKSLIIFED
jgi:threonine dehydrogenase-like Zn-dependent dehydrogenase